MNYLASFAVCVAVTLFSALGNSLEVKYLIMSDVNVAIFLLLARMMDTKRAGININLSINKGN